PGVSPQMPGKAWVYPVGGGRESYDLVFDHMTGSGAAIFTARVRSMSTAFTYRGEALDGRTPHPSPLHFDAPPALARQAAWLILPEHCGLKPNGKPYEQPQARGDIVGLRDLSARVQVTLQKPVKQAVLELLGTPYDDLTGAKKETLVQRQAVE